MFGVYAERYALRQKEMREAKARERHEWLVKMPTPPCGEENKGAHYEWSARAAWGCPHCARLGTARLALMKRDADNAALAKAIADEFEKRGL